MPYFQKTFFLISLDIVQQGKLLKLEKVLAHTMLEIKSYLMEVMLNMLLLVKIYVIELMKIQTSKKQLLLS